MTTNVALFAPKFPPDVGGASIYFEQIVSVLDGTAYDPVVVAPMNESQPAASSIDSVPVRRMLPPLGDRIYRGVRHLPQLRRLLADHTIGLAHVHPHFPQYRWFRWLLRALDVPRVYDCRDQGFSRRYVRDGAHYLSATADIDAILRDHVGVSPLDITRSPVVLSGADSPRPINPGPGSVTHLAYVGDLVEHKGVHLAMDAADALAEEQAVVLHIAGGGTEQRRVERREIEDHIEYHGCLPHAESMGLIQFADVLLTPSESEGRPRVAIEAMHVGTPVVGTAAGEIPAVVGDAGVVVDRTVGDFVSGVRAVLADESLRRAAEASTPTESVSEVRDAVLYAYDHARDT